MRLRVPWRCRIFGAGQRPALHNAFSAFVIYPLERLERPVGLNLPGEAVAGAGVAVQTQFRGEGTR